MKQMLWLLVTSSHKPPGWDEADPPNPAKKDEQQSKKTPDFPLNLLYLFFFFENMAPASEEFQGLPDSWVENTVP